MKYIINKIIIFNAEDQTISLYESPLNVTRLTRPACRLLLELIQNNGMAVTREELLMTVWTNLGFNGSNAGLNNYISELRKAFILLDCHHELITTLPKKGFKFNADIETTLVSILGDPQINATTKNGKGFIEEHENSKPVISEKPKRLTINRRNTIKTLCVLSMIALIYLYITPNQPYQKVGNIEKCDIYAEGKTNDFYAMKARIASTLEQENISCINDESDIFYVASEINNNQPVSELISICNKIDVDIYDRCINIKNQRNKTQ